jgi:uncharacterized membrane protein YcaP (DUF421 family)
MELMHSVFGVGVEAQHLTVLQVVCRAVLMFFAALCIIRLADKRFFAKKTAFDVLLGLMLASMLSRAINGSEPLVPTIAGGLTMALLHRLLGALACRWPQFGGWIKGHSQTVIVEGKPDSDVLRKHHIGEDDLLEELRLNGIESPSEAKLARLERSGEISVIKAETHS